jgi:hypothetical protein
MSQALENIMNGKYQRRIDITASSSDGCIIPKGGSLCHGFGVTLLDEEVTGLLEASSSLFDHGPYKHA